MGNIERRHIIDSSNLSGAAYFTSILQEAYACGLLLDSDIEKIQLECIELLAYKSERYSSGDSSSIRVEAAESIMKSNLFTIGLYLKSLPDADCAAGELKTAMISEMYRKGRGLISDRFDAAKDIYKLVQKNKILTRNYTYNATLSDNGIWTFFRSYNPDYEAHETSASIDYQLCNPVTDQEGVEYIQRYLENLFLENEFCRNFNEEDIHHLLSGYDIGYEDLLINIFEQVLTAALGCSLANLSIVKLSVSKDDIQCLYNKLSEYNDQMLASKIREAAGEVLKELKITSPLLQSYIAKSLPKITSNIMNAIKTETLDKTFVVPDNPDLKPKIRFLPGTKMNDEDYRKLIKELLVCRYSSDKLALIKEKVKSFGDIEDILFDAQLCEEEIALVFGILGDVEIAELIKRHPFVSDIQAVDLSEGERVLRLYLQSYINQLEADRQKKIFETVDCLIEE